MISKNVLYLFLKNTIIYTAICVGCYVLYSYHFQLEQNIPHTDFSFIYAQF
jgi:hypothetical protein